MKITKRQLRQIIKEEKAKVLRESFADAVNQGRAQSRAREEAEFGGVSPAINSLLQKFESQFEMQINAALGSEDRRWWQNDDVILAVTDMLDDLKATMAAYGQVNEAINEADMTNDSRVQELIKTAEMMLAKGKLLQGDVDEIKRMARNGYSASQIRRRKYLRF
jgi:hypothetical protein